MENTWNLLLRVQEILKNVTVFVALVPFGLNTCAVVHSCQLPASIFNDLTRDARSLRVY